MKTVFILEHIYEVDEIDEIKFIGVFSTIEIAQKAIDKLIKQPGFNNYPIESFQISNNIIDQIGWEEGFIPINNATD